MTRLARCFSMAAAVTILGTGVLASSEAQATSGGCLIPDFATDLFTSEFMDDVDLSSSPKHCRKQCNDFRQGCHRVCRASDRCNKDSIKAVVNAEQENCRELSGEARRECVDSLKDFRQGYLETLGYWSGLAKDDCEQEWQDCLDSCDGELAE